MVYLSAEMAIPVTAIQAFASRASFGSIHLPPEQIAVNAALAVAVYGKDRLEGEDPLAEADGLSLTRASALASVFYARSDWTLGALILILHSQYASLKRSFLSRAKPLLVGFFWTLAADEPNIIRSDLTGHPHLPVSTLAWVFSLSVFLSHAADIGDAEEDKANGILTPAVWMGAGPASHWAAGLALASVSLHPACPYHDRIDAVVDVAVLLSAIRLLVPRLLHVLVSSCSALGFGISIFRYRLHIANAFFLSTEHPHTQALSAAARLSEWGQTLPEEQKQFVLHTLGHTLELFDTMGHEVVRLYSKFLQLI